MSDGERQAAEWLASRCRVLAGDGKLRSESITLLDIAAQASEPLRVAVVGAVSTGKSELVNALLGKKRASVAHQEMTSRVTWFRDPGLPDPPPLGPAHSLEKAAFPLSKSIVLIDTPGLDTVSGNQRLTETMLTAGNSAAGSAAAVIYLVGPSVPDEGLRWLRRFAALNAGPFDLHAGIVLAGSKADLYETEGFGQGTRESRNRLMRNLRDEAEQKAGHLVGHVVAVMPGLAALARTEAFSRDVLAQVELVAETPELRGGVSHGWPYLRETARSHAPGLDVGPLSELIGSSLGLKNAADLLARDRPADPGAVIRELWGEMSGIQGLDEVLGSVAATGDVLTITAVVRRLERLATKMERQLGAPIYELLTAWRAHPASEVHDRNAAALVLEGDQMAYLAPEDRLEAARMLRGTGRPLTPEARARWGQAGMSWQVTSRDAQIVRMVMDLSLR